MQRLGRAIDAVLALDPAAPAVEFDQTWTTWGEMTAVKAAVQARLAPLGPGGRVGVAMRNRPEVVAAVLACIGAQACLVTLNPMFPDEVLAEEVGRIEAPVIVATRADWARPGVLAAGAAAGALCLALTGDAEGPVVELRPADRPLKDFPRAYAPGVAVEMLTSGTTGRPKRIPLAAADFEQTIFGAALFEAGRSADSTPKLRGGVTMVTNPISHISGLIGAVNFVLAGRRACLMERFQVDRYLDALRRHRPKVAAAPPAAIRMIMEARPDPDTFSSLLAFRTGTAPLEPGLAEAFHAAYGVPVLQNYGATEFGGVAGWTLADHKIHWAEKRGAVGRLNPELDGRAVDPETQAPLPPGTQGVLQLKGPKIGDGVSWVTTTDLAIVDADRFVYILGRADNAIIRGGFKVHPEDVVAALQAHPAVQEAAVVGMPDARLGATPRAACILKPGAEAPTEADLLAFLRNRLSSYQIPTRILIVEELPRTASMKVSQPDLKRLFED